jgi:hypothetical protein
MRHATAGNASPYAPKPHVKLPLTAMQAHYAKHRGGVLILKKLVYELVLYMQS